MENEEKKQKWERKREKGQKRYFGAKVCLFFMKVPPSPPIKPPRGFRSKPMKKGGWEKIQFLLTQYRS